MNPNELLNQVKELIEKKDFSAAQKFINDNKDQLGDYFEQAKKLVEGAGGVDGVLDKVKGFFGDK
ncbi:hypothetical protein [Streptococcus henryi]|jgi:hypothetical protein|uniref:hypothetical protein n=1 Tax=Streptococcus henryi TaxID=439219 RepID=UPI000371E599|nr:hypothetical protein [Streptococcus henryi]